MRLEYELEHGCSVVVLKSSLVILFFHMLADISSAFVSLLYVVVY
jgi:hypothetical protein